MHNLPLERPAAAVYFTCGRASRVRRRVAQWHEVMAPDANAILDELKDDPTVVLWRGMLVDVGGMAEADFAEYVARWRDDILYDKSGWFYHDTAGYYAAEQLLPRKLFETYRQGDLIPLKNEIHYILDRYFHQQEFDRARIPEVRLAIDKVVREWTAANPPVR